MTNDKTREEELELFIADAAAFIRWCYANDKMSMCETTLIHDILGLDGYNRSFTPRVDGYLAREEGEYANKR